MRQIIAIIALLVSISVAAQRVDYEGGYFKRSDTTWNEYKPEEREGVWNTFTQYSEDNNYWYAGNSLCKIAIPKDVTKCNFHIQLPGKGWEQKYVAKKTKKKKKKPKPVNTRPEGAITCVNCNGTGWALCLWCHGTGSLMRNVATGYGVYQTYDPCYNCAGVGKSVCNLCKGKGWMIPQPPDPPKPKPKPKPEDRVCSVCGGTGIGNTNDTYTPDGIGASKIKYTNQAGNQCPYCGSYRYHCHFKCGGCNGTGR